MGSESKKNQIACRVSRETYQKVRALTEGENPPFESVSEYLTTLIAADLGRRGGTVPGGAMDQMTPAKAPLAPDVPVAWRGIEGFFRRYAGEYPKFSPGVLYRVNMGPWQLADTIDQVPTGAELHPCHRQRGEG